MIVSRTLLMLAYLMMVLCAGPVLAAEWVVVNSTAADIIPGKVVQHDRSLTLAAGASVTLISESGKTVTLEGPFQGTVGIGGGADDGGALITSLSNLFGTTGTETTSVGVMRSFAFAPPDDPWVIDVNRSGDHCVLARGVAYFWRDSDKASTALVIKKMTAPKAEGETAWPAGKRTLAWPQAVPKIEGAIYLVRTKASRTARKVVLHLVPEGLASDAHRAAWMADRGCKKQARTLLSVTR